MRARTHFFQHRRPLTLLAALIGSAALLAACGGGGHSAPPADNSPPRIERFGASSTSVFVGERVKLRADFSGGNGSISPNVGSVQSGQEVDSPVLDRDTRFSLVVQGAFGQPATQTLDVSVRFRDRYATAASPFSAAEHAAVATDDGSVLLLGGSRGERVLSSAIDRFDPATGNIRRVGEMIAGRASHTATRLPGGRVLVTGGAFSTGELRAEVIDERTGASSASGRMSVFRSEHAAVAIAGGRVLVTGGLATGEGNLNGYSRSAEIWEPQTGQFRRLESRMAVARAAHTLTLLPDGRVLVVGGFTSSPTPVLAEIFDPATERFAPVPSTATLPMRGTHAALLAPDGGVLVVGGALQVPGVDEVMPTASVLRFDPATQQFSELPALLAPRMDVRAVMLPGSARGPGGSSGGAASVLLFGGSQGGADNLATAERYDSATGGRAIATLDAPRAQHSVVRLVGGRVAVFGGQARNGDFASSVQIYE